MSEFDREVEDALKRAGADDLGVPRARYRREPEPLPDPPSWGPLSFLQPATPWHLLGIGALFWLIGQLLGRAAPGDLLETVGFVLLAVGVLSLIILKRPSTKRWRGRLIELDDSWRTRLYRRIYRR